MINTTSTLGDSRHEFCSSQPQNVRIGRSTRRAATKNVRIIFQMPAKALPIRPLRLTGQTPNDRNSGDPLVPSTRADALPRRVVWVRGGSVEYWVHLRRAAWPPPVFPRRGEARIVFSRSNNYVRNLVHDAVGIAERACCDVALAPTLLFCKIEQHRWRCGWNRYIFM